MSNVLHRSTKEYRISVHTNDYPESEWIINPDMTTVDGVEQKYWKIEGDTISPMSNPERNVIDLADLPRIKDLKKTSLVQQATSFISSLGYDSNTCDTLIRLYSESTNSRPKRNKYIGRWMRWMQQAEDHLDKKLAEVDSRNNANAVNNVSINFVTIENGDPKITVSEAMATLDSENIANFLDANSEVTDEQTGIIGPFHIMQTLQMRKDLYNDSENPLYFANHTPILGAGGILHDHSERVLNLESIHSKSGWHNQQILKSLYKAPKNLLIYYGYPSGFNSVTNAWTIELIAQDMATYSLIVLGDGVQNPSHTDFANTTAIINRIKQINWSCKIFGYVTLKQNQENFRTKSDQWNSIGVHGIFIDEAGYDFGKTRKQFNNAIDYVHSLSSSKIVFANAWNTNNLVGLEDDPSFPNTTFNPDLEQSKINENDWILLESFPVNTLAYPNPTNYCNMATWMVRAQRAITTRELCGVNLAASCVINNSRAQAAGDRLFKLGYASAMILSLEAYGSSDHNYGASSADGVIKVWSRTGFADLFAEYSVSPCFVQNPLDMDVAFRYIDNKKLFIDLSPEANLSGLK